MIRSAVTVCLVPEARKGPFVFHTSLAEGCARAAALGFDAIELFPTHADDLDGLELRDLLRTHKLHLAAVGTGAGWLRRKLALTDPDPHVRMCARDFAGAIIDFAGGFGVPAIIGSMQGRVADGVDREQSLEWLRQELGQLGPRAHALDVPLLYEPLNRYETNLFNTIADSLDFLGTLTTRNVKLLVDLFHANIEERDLAAAIRLAGPAVGHVHFADSNRQAIGLGHTDVAPVVQALRDIAYDGYVSAEVLPLPDPDTAARQTIESFRRWFRG
ncbi:MAG: sugar phosphate isomerase/epimerase [Verrucomicrobiales bacterium]|nr:sugar phosphate isomerase/epimerase [Verrucomicrobiales bacterium]